MSSDTETPDTGGKGDADDSTDDQQAAERAEEENKRKAAEHDGAKQYIADVADRLAKQEAEHAAKLKESIQELNKEKEKELTEALADLRNSMEGKMVVALDEAKRKGEAASAKAVAAKAQQYNTLVEHYKHKQADTQAEHDAALAALVEKHKDEVMCD